MAESVPEMLSNCGYPTQTVVIDFETYFDDKYTLKKMGSYEYLKDTRFEILGAAVKFGASPARFCDWRSVESWSTVDWPNVTVVMHKAPFDALVLAQKFDIHPPYIVDTLDLARHIEPRHRNSLEVLCDRYDLPAKGDTKQFKGVSRRDLTVNPLLHATISEYSNNDAHRTYDLLQIMLPRLSNPAFELRLAQWTRNLFIYPSLSFNQEKAEGLKGSMKGKIAEAVAETGCTEKDIRGTKSFLRLIAEALVGEEPPMKVGKLGPLLAIAKTDPGREYLLYHRLPAVCNLMAARIACKSWPLHIRRVERLQSTSEAAGGVLPVPLKYYGAHTGRWSGGEGINLQNLPARADEIANEVRGTIEAPEGYVLIIWDLSQIEARDTVWLAGQDDMVEKFAAGEPVYCQFAAELTGRPVRKVRPGDSKVLKQWHTKFRGMGKVGVLGCGFGMGRDRCLEYARNTYGIDLTPAQADEIVKLYRKRNSRVTAYWRLVETAFRNAIWNPGRSYALTKNMCVFQAGDTTVVELPNHRRLYYKQARVEGTTRRPQLVMPHPKEPGSVIPFWGGYLVENIVQATSRDILTEAILNIEDELGYRIPLTVHDDASVVVPENEADAAVKKIEAIVRRTPTWATGLPLDLEIQVSKSYVK